MAIVVANMIGTGAFTSLGFQLKELHHPTVILGLWILGGILALFGAFSYAELSTRIKESGGEYAYITRIFGPLMGYLSGWVSTTVGFAAPVALSAIAFVEYFPVAGLNQKLTSIALVACITLIHSKSLKLSSGFQNISTFLKAALIVLFIILGIVFPSENVTETDLSLTKELLSPAFAIALIFVMYSYSGWNAAAYISHEFKNPLKSLPVALVGGTLLVTILYTLLQYVFLKHVPINELRGQLNVGTLAAQKLVGKETGVFFSLAISLFLVSGISAMVWVGPRVTSSIAQHHKLWKFFAVNKQEIPRKAIWFQFVLTAFLILTGSFEQIMIYCGFLLTLSSMIAVSGVFFLRKEEDAEAYKSPLFPIMQLLFIALSIWMMAYAFINNPTETLAGSLNLFIGWLTYVWSKKLN